MPENFPDVKSYYSLVKRPAFGTVIAKYGNYSKVEQRLALGQSPVHTFVMSFPFLTITEADLIYDFFIARKGQHEVFYLQNQEEAYRGAPWQPSHVYAKGTIIRPSSITGRSYRCVIPGTSNNSVEPTWPTAYHGTVADSTAVWMENSYIVRFAQDVLDAQYVWHNLYDFGRIELLEVAA